MWLRGLRPTGCSPGMMNRRRFVLSGAAMSGLPELRVFARETEASWLELDSDHPGAMVPVEFDSGSVNARACAGLAEPLGGGGYPPSVFCLISGINRLRNATAAKY